MKSHIENKILKKTVTVQKHILPNKMTLLMCEDHSQPNVSIILFYNVGSKDEQDGEKGMAHFIEHMIFKGTVSMLSESDINAVAQMLSGSINAFTSYDCTGYQFNLPSTQWKEVFPILADCMENVEFSDQKINSEVKAVIQELKMYKDSFVRALMMDMMACMFRDHPYHYPVIGYKEDLLNMFHADLKKFYEKNYIPNNATLVIVGDIIPEEVIQETESTFKDIKPNFDYQKKDFVGHDDVVSTSVTMYRDIEQPIFIMAFSVPGLKSKTAELPILTKWILGEKRNCRLYKKLVTELGLVTEVHAAHYALFDRTVFYILCYPKTTSDIPRIESEIYAILSSIAEFGISDDEIKRAIKNYRMQLSHVVENFQDKAEEIGTSYIVSGDSEYLLNILDNIDTDEVRKKVENYIKTYLRPSVAHIGKLLPAPLSEKNNLHALQEQSDAQDTKIIENRVRTTEVEPPRYAETIIPKMPKPFVFPKPTIQKLSNGLTLLCNNQTHMDRVTLAIEFKAYDAFFEPEDNPGIYTFMTEMMIEGTKNYTAETLAEFLEARAMSLDVSPGGITIECLKEDIEVAFSILKELVVNVDFKEEKLEKVRAKMLSNYRAFWDNPNKFSPQLLRDVLYKGHPWSKHTIGTEVSIHEFTKAHIIDLAKQFLSPQDATLVVVGAVDCKQVQELTNVYLGSWKGDVVPSLVYPDLKRAIPHTVDYQIQRDQVVLMLGNISITRHHKDYEKLLIFDQIFGGGVLGSMMSRLFALREATGLFYTIMSSLVSGASEQPGIFYIHTIVSRDRLEEAIVTIKKAVDEALDVLTDEEIEEAKRAILYTQTKMCRSSSSIAQAFLMLNRLQLPFDYYDQRYAQFEKITTEDVKNAAQKHLVSDNLVVLQVGRI